MEKFKELINELEELAKCCELEASKAIKLLGAGEGHMFYEKEISSAQALRYSSMRVKEIMEE